MSDLNEPLVQTLVSRRHQTMRKMTILIVICVFFILGEVIGGIISHSISIISDSIHMFTDLISFLITIISIKISLRQANDEYSYGFFRIEIIGAMVNLFLIWTLTLFLIYEAIDRIIERQMVTKPLVMVIVASLGLVINLVMAKILHENTDNANQSLFKDEDDRISSHSHDSHKHHVINQRFNSHQPHNHDQHGHHAHDHDHDHHDHDHEHHDHDHQHHDHDHDHEQHDHEQGKKECKSKKIGPISQCQMIDCKKKVKDTECEDCLGCYKCQKQPFMNYCDHHNVHQQQKIDTYEGDCTFSKLQIVPSKAPSHGHSHGHSHSNSHGHSHGHSHGGAHSHQFLSVQGAMLHVITDIIQSVGVLLGSLLIFFLGSTKGSVQQYNYWHLADPICTLLFSVLVMFSTKPLTVQMFNIIMHKNQTTMRASVLASFKQIKKQYMLNIHDLHVWELTPSNFVVTAHVVCKDEGESLSLVAKKLTKACRSLGIKYTTFQIESLNDL